MWGARFELGRATTRTIPLGEKSFQLPSLAYSNDVTASPHTPPHHSHHHLYYAFTFEISIINNHKTLFFLDYLLMIPIQSQMLLFMILLWFDVDQFKEIATNKVVLELDTCCLFVAMFFLVILVSFFKIIIVCFFDPDRLFLFLI
jgi:hypothetical protein